MDFNTYWTLIGGDINFSNRKTAAEKAWSLCPPEKQQAIISWLQAHGQYPGRNPYFFILDWQTKTAQQTLTMTEYYTRYGTTEPQDGWRQENPTGQKVIYVKP